MAYWVVSKHSVPQISNSHIWAFLALSKRLAMFTPRRQASCWESKMHNLTTPRWEWGPMLLDISFLKRSPMLYFPISTLLFPVILSLSLSHTHTHSSSSSSQKPAPREAEPENRPSSAGMREQTGLEEESQWKIQVDFTAQVLDEDRTDFQK